MYMTAIAYNLKKLLRFTRVEQSGMVIPLPVPDQLSLILIYFCNSHISYTTTPEKVQGLTTVLSDQALYFFLTLSKSMLGKLVE